MKKLSMIMITLLALLLVPANVSATVPQISIPVNTVERGSEGSIINLANIDIQDEYVGLECAVSAIARNQSSVHPGNDLSIESATTVLIKDVERESNGTVEATGKIELSDKLSVNLIMGQDEVFSGGLDVDLKCEQPPAEVEVCRDGVEITIKENERLETDTDLPCPLPEVENVQVCRDGKIITIAKDDVKDTDTDTCPKVLAAKTLPNTGPGSTALILAGTGVFGTLAHVVYTKKQLS